MFETLSRLPIPPEGDVQIFANPECTKYATGTVSKVYARINRPWGFDKNCVIGDKSGTNVVVLNSPNVEYPNDLYNIVCYADFSSQDFENPFTAGQVVECSISEYTEPYDVTDYDKVFTYVPEFVDLGLPSGTKWAKCNLGANKNNYYGKYFSWGNIEGVTSVDTEGIAAMTEAAYAQTKGATLTGDIPATAEYDAAVARFQGIADCQIPTQAQFQELVDECTWAWQDDYNGTGIKGYLVTSKTNGNHIFLPAAGFINNGGLTQNLSMAGTSTIIQLNKSLTALLMFNKNMHVVYNNSTDSVPRYFGLTIRPVQNA